MKRVYGMVLIGCLVMVCATTFTVEAATIRVRCEQRSDRSKVSVDAKNLAPAEYQAQVMSGSNEVTSDLQAAIGDEVAFDFNSDPDNIADGATPIAVNFIQGGQVTGKILDADGMTVIADTVGCKVKN